MLSKAQRKITSMRWNKSCLKNSEKEPGMGVAVVGKYMLSNVECDRIKAEYNCTFPLTKRWVTVGKSMGPPDGYQGWKSGY